MEGRRGSAALQHRSVLDGKKRDTVKRCKEVKKRRQKIKKARQEEREREKK